MAASCRKPERGHICFYPHSRGTGDPFLLQDTPVSLRFFALGAGTGVSSLATYSGSCPPGNREDPGSPACVDDRPSAAQRQAGAPGTVEHLEVFRAAGTF